MEIKTQRGTVLIVVAVEIMIEEIVELITAEDVGARIYHSAAWQVLVIGGILATVELVHHHLPHGMAPGWAALQVTVATVRHAEVHGVRP